MDDYAVYLSEEAESSIAALHEFKILYSSDQKCFHFFFEGDDDILFYMPEARRLVGEISIYTYRCGGKKNVIETRNSLRSDGYDVSGCLFFIDRDYDDILNCQPIIDDFTYLTDSYSIENSVATIGSAKIIMDDIIHISRADPSYEQIEMIIESAFQDFYRIMRPLTAWILASREAGYAPNLNNTKGLKGIVTLFGTTPRIDHKGFASFKKLVAADKPSPSVSSLIRWYRRLRPEDFKLWVRGKYDLWFFQTALLAALDLINDLRRREGRRAFRVPANLREGRIFEILGGRLPAPASLLTFYEARLH